MSDEVNKRVPVKRRAAPPSPEVKRERFARFLDTQTAVYEGMGSDAADFLKEHRDAILDSPELIAQMDKFRPDMSAEEAREYGVELARLFESIIPKPEPVVMPARPAAEIEAEWHEATHPPCGLCGVKFNPYEEAGLLRLDSPPRVFTLSAWGSEPDEGEERRTLGYICPRCTLALCKEVVIQHEREGRAE